MPSNRHRAGRIETVLMEYRDPDDEAALADLLTDALHYCAIHGKDFALAIERAKRHFAFERQLDEGGDHE
jgi:NTP pyrophosphatase (non-canonical NTP hydrolase)